MCQLIFQNLLPKQFSSLCCPPKKDTIRPNPYGNPLGNYVGRTLWRITTEFDLFFTFFSYKIKRRAKDSNQFEVGSDKSWQNVDFFGICCDFGVSGSFLWKFERSEEKF